MELYIKDDLSDISYQSELTLDILKSYLQTKCQGLIRRRPSAYDLRHYRSVSRLLIKGGMENG